MTTPMTADDLRKLAEAIDRLTDVTTRTTVEMGGWAGDPQITYKDHALRLTWQPATDEQAGQYVVEIPEPTH